MRFGSTSNWGVLLGFVAAAAIAQTAPPASAAPPPVPYASVNELNQLLSQVEQMSQSAQADFAKIRIEKWKTDGNTKRATEADVGSIQRNLQSALPEIVTQLRSSPEDLAASFKLYRNLDALYDVFGSVVESAGAFGPKEDFQLLQEDLGALERSRRALADRLETLATTKESELTRLRTEVRTLQAAQQPASPPKKVVVDDTEPPKKTTKKKSPTKTAKTPSSNSTQNSSNSGAQPVQQQNPPNPPPSPQQ
jgi:hypothetical protein